MPYESSITATDHEHHDRRRPEAHALTDPAAVLAEHGVTLAEGHSVTFLEDTDTLTHIVLSRAESYDEAEALEQRTSKLIFG